MLGLAAEWWGLGMGGRRVRGKAACCLEKQVPAKRDSWVASYMSLTHNVVQGQGRPREARSEPCLALAGCDLKQPLKPAP